MRRLIVALALLLAFVPSPAGAIIDLYGFARSEQRVEVIGSTSTSLSNAAATAVTYYSQPIPPSYVGPGGRLRVTVFLSYGAAACAAAGAATSDTVTLNYGAASFALAVVTVAGDGANGCGSGAVTANVVVFYVLPVAQAGATPRQMVLYATFGTCTSPVAAVCSPVMQTSATATVSTVDPSQPQTMSVTFTGSSSTSTQTVTAQGLMVERLPGFGTPLGGVGWTQP